MVCLPPRPVTRSFFFFSSRRRHTRSLRDWSSDVCSSDLKARGMIREAWSRHGVRNFALDSAEELAKILQEIGVTGVSGELGLVVRLALPKGPAVLDLSGKFGADPETAVGLLRAARGKAARLGVSFHVGSQCLEPLAWRAALALVGQVIRGAGVAIEMIDVGGGF